MHLIKCSRRQKKTTFSGQKIIGTIMNNSLLLGNFACFLLSADFFSKNSVRIAIRGSNSLVEKNIRPDLGPNCSQKLSADDTSR